MAKILGLKIEGIRKIKAAELDLSGGNLVQIRGRNQAGKSTILLAIEMLFGGKGVIPDDVITHGKEAAQIIARVDDITIKRVIRKNGYHALSVEKGEMTRAKPQEFLNTLAGKFLDPQLFSNLPGPEMKKMLMQHLGIDFRETDAKISRLEIKRRDIGRDRKAQGEPVPADKVEPVSLDALLEERKGIDSFNNLQRIRAEQIRTANQNIEKLKSIKDQAVIQKKTTVTEKQSLIEEYERKIKELKSQIGALEKETIKISDAYDLKIMEAEENRDKLVAPEEKKSVDALERKIRDAEKINKKAGEYNAYVIKKALCQQMDADYEKCTSEIRELKASKETRLREAKMPVPGLTITETGLSLDGIINENWSDSQALKVAMHISAALSKELKTMFIRRGESLDSASLAEVKKFADENDFQVIIEIVDDSYNINQENVFYIEEGEIIKPENLEEKK